MMRNRFLPIGGLLILAMLAPRSIGSQALRVHPKPLGVRPLLLCIACSLTVSATPTSVSFILTSGGVATGSAAVSITTVQTGISSIASVKLYGYFSSASAALTDGATTPDNIPSSSVLGLVATGSPTTYTAFTQSNTLGPAGAGLLLYSATSLGTTGCPLLTTCRTDNLSLEIDTTALPHLPAGTYTGTLILQAQAL